MSRFESPSSSENDPYFNPFEAPKTLEPKASPWVAPSFEGPNLWREGNILVLEKGTEFPDRCVKCNAPAGGYRLNRRLSWHPPGWYIVIFVCNILIYVIVAMIVRKTATVRVGLCEAHRRRRRQAIIWGWSGALFGIGLCIAGAALGEKAAAPCLVIGSLLVLTSMIAGLLIAQTVSPARIDDRYVRLKGVGRAFLDELPVQL